MSAQVVLGLEAAVTSGRAKREPEHRCPVGWCRVPLAARATVDGPGAFCGRHRGKLSYPMAHQLGVARRIGGAELERVFAAAVVEARRHDPAWRAWAVLWSYNPRVKLESGGEHRRIDGYNDHARALRRVTALRRAGIPSSVRNIATDEELDGPAALWRCPHRVVDGGVEVQRGWTLGSALLGLWVHPDPDLERFEVINTTTDGAMGYAEAQALEGAGCHA